MGLSDYYAQDSGYAQGTNYDFGSEDIARRLKIVTNHMPKLRRAPSFALAMAQLPVDDNSLMNAVRADGSFGWARETAGNLRSTSGDQQRKAWEKMNRNQRAVLAQSGYSPPEEHHSFWDPLKTFIPGSSQNKQYNATLGRAEGDISQGAAKVTDVRGALKALTGSDPGQGALKPISEAKIPYASDAAGATLHGVAGVPGDVGAVASRGLHYMDVLGKVPSHLYRFESELYDRMAQPDYSDSFGEWSNIWEETGTKMGEGYWPQHVHDQVADIMPNERKQTWAKKLAMGDTPADIASRYAKADSNLYQKVYANILDTSRETNFRQAMKVLETGKVSVGRDVANGFGLSPNSTPYKAISGSVDMIQDLALDPMLIGMNLTKVSGAFTRSLTLLGDAEELKSRMIFLRGAEEGKLASSDWGDQWLEKVLDPNTSTYDIVKRGGYTTAFTHKVAAAFAAPEFADEAGKILNPSLARLVDEVPSTRRAMETLVAANEELRTDNIAQLVKNTGVELSAEERAAVKGFKTSDDVWNFLESDAFKQSVTRGEFGGFTREYLELPRLTRRGLFTARSKMALEGSIDFLRNEGVRSAVALAPDEVFTQGGQVTKVSDIQWAIPGHVGTFDSEIMARRAASSAGIDPDTIVNLSDELAPDTTRLYQVRLNDATGGAVLPDHIHPESAAELGVHNWWTDDLNHARASAQAFGPTGTLYVLDAPTSALSDIPEAMAVAPGHEFNIVDDAIESQRMKLGTVGDWVEVNKKVLPTPLHQILAPPAKFLHAATHKVPEEAFISTYGADFMPQVERLLDMGLSSSSKRMWMNQLLADTNPGMRRQILNSAIDHIFAVNGVYGNEGGVEFAQKFLNGTKQIYAANGEDLMFIGGSSLRQGIMPVSDHANAISIPAFRDVMAQSRRGSMIKTMLGGTTSPQIESFMGTYWKPSVLLRVGFIPRAAGEELLSTVLRFPDLVKNQWLLRPFALNEGQPLWFFRPLETASNFMRHFLPEVNGNYLDQFTEYVVRRASGAIRGAAAKAMDPAQLEAARAIAQHGYIFEPYTHELAKVSGVHNMAYSGIPSEDDLWVMPLNREKTKFARILKSESDREMYLRNHEAYQGQLASEVKRTMSVDPAGRVIAAAGAVGADADRLNELDRAVKKVSPGFAEELLATMGDPTPDKLLREMRNAVDDDALRPILDQYEDLKRTLGVTPKELKVKLEHIQNVADDASPAGKMLAKVWGDLGPGARDMILADERAVLRHLGGAAENDLSLASAITKLPEKAPEAERFYISSYRHPADMDPASLSDAVIYDNPDDALRSTYDGGEAPAGFKLYYVDVTPEMMVDQVPGEHSLGLMDMDAQLFSGMHEVPRFAVANPLDETKAIRARNLIDRARAGDHTARDELQDMTARQWLEDANGHPALARYVRENVRSTMTRDGRRVMEPLVGGKARVYTLLATPEGMESIGQADPTVAKELMSMRVNSGEFSRVAASNAQHGLPAYQPVSRYATSDRSQIEAALQSLGGDRPDRFAIGFTDVADKRLNSIHADGLGDMEAWGVRPVPPDTQLLNPGEVIPGTTPDVVKNVGVPEALDDWASTMRTKVNQLTTSPVDGRFNHEIGGRASRRGDYSLDDLTDNSIETQHLPEGVAGPKFYTEIKNLWQRTVERGFGTINKAIGAIAREPLFFHNFSTRYAQGKIMLNSIYENPEVTQDMLKMVNVQGGQKDILRTYRSVFEHIEMENPELAHLNAWTEGTDKKALEQVLGTAAQPTGVKTPLFDDIKAHFKSMTGDEITTLRAYVENQRRIDTQVADAALEGAVFDTIPFIDDHAVRSQMSEMGRSLAPFFFAEEQFLKRWARVMVHSPEAIRRGQLLFMGMKHSGLVRQNQYGDDVWVMPGSAVLQEVLGRTTEMLTGSPYTIPVSVPFTGVVKYSLPGFNRVGVPSFSPLVGIPMNLMARRFPELNDTNEQILGDQQAGRSLVDQILPVSMMRVYRAAFDNPSKSAQYSSAMIQAAQYMEANGLAPGPDATPHERQLFIDRIENWTRINLLNRAIFGFVAPAAPQMEFPKNLAPELQTLLRNLPYDEAIAQFQKDNPDATAYTVFQTQSPSGAQMPTTKEVGKFLDNNRDFVARHMMAVPWMLPQAASDDPTQRSVYNRQVKLGLRERKSPEAWLDDYAFAVAAPEYFDSRDSYDQARLLHDDDPEAKAALDAGWADWKAKFFVMHPVFEEQLGSRDAHNRRMRVLADTRDALQDPTMPKIEHVNELSALVNGWYTFNTSYKSLAGDRTAGANQQRKNLRIGFINWGRALINDHPSVQAYWQRNIEPELGVDASLEQDLLAVK